MRAFKVIYISNQLAFKAAIAVNRVKFENRINDTVRGDSELDEESNHLTLRQAQGERLFSVHAEPDEARRAQCERKIQTNFRLGT